MSTNKNLLTCDQNAEFLAYNHFKGCMEGVGRKPMAWKWRAFIDYKLSLIMN